MSKKQWGLEFNSFPRNIQWAVDIDYVDKLNEEQKYFLNLFLQEYYKNHFDKEEKPIHDTPELKISCSRKSDSSRRDISSIYGDALLNVDDLNDSLTGLAAWMPNDEQTKEFYKCKCSNPSVGVCYSPQHRFQKEGEK